MEDGYGGVDDSQARAGYCSGGDDVGARVGGCLEEGAEDHDEHTYGDGLPASELFGKDGSGHCAEEGSS